MYCNITLRYIIFCLFVIWYMPFFLYKIDSIKFCISISLISNQSALQLREETNEHINDDSFPSRVSRNGKVINTIYKMYRYTLNLWFIYYTVVCKLCTFCFSSMYKICIILINLLQSIFAIHFIPCELGLDNKNEKKNNWPCSNT